MRAFGDITNAATDGNFTKLVDVEASGEMDELKRKINQMVYNLRDSIQRNTQAREAAEQANKTKSETMGVLENLKISVGPVELQLQVQVMKDAPYDMLLGRPFYALAQCVTKDYTSGDQYITITDPNTKHEIMIPTRDRIRNKVASAKTDFQASRSR